MFAIDGVKLSSNASKAKSDTRKDYQRQLTKMQTVVIEGVQHPTPLGVPQGGPPSPLLANIVLHELDVYLQQQKRSFARYADDFVICVKSTSAAQRVKANVTRFFDKRLKLHINHDKSRIVPSTQLEFLGFSFRGTKLAWCDKALVRFKQRVRQLTGRS